MSNRDHLAPVPDALVSQVHDVEVVSDLAFTDLPSVMWGLPDDITEDLRSLHRSLVDGMRRDAQHLPTGTLAAMQLERVAFYYIKLRYYESQGGWTRQERGVYYKLYRDAANDLASQGHSKKISPDELHGIVSQHTAKIVAQVLRTLPADQAKPLYRRFAAALDEGVPAS